MEAEKQEFLAMRRMIEECKAIVRAQWIKDREGGMAGWERNCPFGDHVSLYDCVTGEDGVMRPRTKEEKEALEAQEWEEELARRRKVEEEELLAGCGGLAEKLASSKLEGDETAGEKTEQGLVTSPVNETNLTTPISCCSSTSTSLTENTFTCTEAEADKKMVIPSLNPRHRQNSNPPFDAQWERKLPAE